MRLAANAGRAERYHRLRRQGFSARDSSKWSTSEAQLSACPLPAERLEQLQTHAVEKAVARLEMALERDVEGRRREMFRDPTPENRADKYLGLHPTPRWLEPDNSSLGQIIARMTGRLT